MDSMSGNVLEVSICAVPKPFRGHIGTIQRNALTSWKELEIIREIILLGGEDGIADAATSLGAIHYRDLEVDEFGTPLLDDVLQAAQRLSTSTWLCLVNADIVLLPEFGDAVAHAVADLAECLVVSRRWNLDVKEPLDFAPGWQARLREQAASAASLFSPWGIDVFVFPKNMFGKVPPFAIGRSSWDNWLIMAARKRGYPVVDATAKFGVIHQNHAYDGFLSIEEIRRSQQGLRNFWLAGDSWFGLGRIDDSTHEIRAGRAVPTGRRSVSVVVQHGGWPTELQGCLRALSVQSYPRTYLEIIVVETGDQSVSVASAREFSFATFTRESKPGPVAARNKGAAIAQGDLIAFIDGNCYPAGDWIEKAVAVSARNGDECIVACNIKPGTIQASSPRVRRYDAVVSRLQNEAARNAGACIGSGLIVPRQVWRKVGAFDERFSDEGWETWEWSRRASSRGVRILYAADAVITHPVHKTWHELRNHVHRLVRGGLRLAVQMSNERSPDPRALRRAYLRQLLRSLRAAFFDRGAPKHSRNAAVAAAALVWYWSASEIWTWQLRDQPSLPQRTGRRPTRR
jgi:GT2 family glycosyltransferase